MSTVSAVFGNKTLAVQWLIDTTDIIKGFACTGPASAFEFVATMNAEHKPEIEEDGVVYTQENKE